MLRILSACAVGVVILGAVSCSGAGSASSVSKSAEVLLVPELNAGTAGWCMIRVSASEGGCPVVRSDPPIVAETWTSGDRPPATEGYAITTEEVAAVSVDGEAPVSTRAESVLPSGLRAVVVEIHGPESQPGSGVPKHRPRFTPLNAKGNAIPQSAAVRPSANDPSGPLSVTVPTRTVTNPAHPSSGICRIAVARFRGLKVLGGSVVAQATPYSGLIGQGFLSCASTSYNLNGWSLLAGMLLNASHPGATPPPLPGMEPLSGHPGIFEAPGTEGSVPEEDLIARRVHGAWLVVARAKQQQRLRLLEQLRATVHI